MNHRQHQEMIIDDCIRYFSNLYQNKDDNSIWHLFWFTESKKALGRFDFRYGRLSLNTTVMDKANDDLLLEVVLHELAHAVTGITPCRKVHGKNWKANAKLLGATPRAKAKMGFVRANYIVGSK